MPDNRAMTQRQQHSEPDRSLRCAGSDRPGRAVSFSVGGGAPADPPHSPRSRLAWREPRPGRRRLGPMKRWTCPARRRAIAVAGLVERESLRVVRAGPRRPGRPHPSRAGRLTPRGRPQGQRGRLSHHVPQGPAGQGIVNSSQIGLSISRPYFFIFLYSVVRLISRTLATSRRFQLNA